MLVKHQLFTAKYCNAFLNENVQICSNCLWRIWYIMAAFFDSVCLENSLRNSLQSYSISYSSTITTPYFYISLLYKYICTLTKYISYHKSHDIYRALQRFSYIFWIYHFFSTNVFTVCCFSPYSTNVCAHLYINIQYLAIVV